MNAKKYKNVIMLLVLCLVLSVLIPWRMTNADADDLPEEDLSGEAVTVTTESMEVASTEVVEAEEESKGETDVEEQTEPGTNETEILEPEEDLSGSASASQTVEVPEEDLSGSGSDEVEVSPTPTPTITVTPIPTATPQSESETSSNEGGSNGSSSTTVSSPTAQSIAANPVVPSVVNPGTSSSIISNSGLNSVIVKEDFRFWTVARKYAFASEDLKIRETMNDDGESVGSLEESGLCYILKEEGNGWDYVESGSVRGFVQEELLITGEEAEELLLEYQEDARTLAKAENSAYQGIETVAPMAEEEKDPSENEAFTYLRATVNPTVCNKVFALAKKDLSILDEGSEDGDEIGTIEKGGLLYIITDRYNDWVYVESGDARGFVAKKDLKTGGVRKMVQEDGEDAFETAKTTVKPSENKAVYYTLTSVQSGVPVGKLRKSILDFAAQYIGNPYVWGGTDPENGADCSGFVQAVYANYGYFLPRVAEDQAEVGSKIPVGEAKPGDLIFYARNGYIYHVVMYAGDGQTIEAHSSATGIIRGTVNYANAVWATRVLKDVDEFSADINEQNATEDMYGQDLGEFKITYYCACAICCDVETGITATGAPVVQGETIAVDPKVIPYGTKVIINGHVFTAEDCGGAIKGNRIDIYVDDHATAQALGVNHYHVYLVK